MSTPTDPKSRKDIPLAEGCLDYFPDALMEVAIVSRVATDQHHPGKPIHWDRSKSADEASSLLRHLIDRGKRDTDGLRHTAKVAWRALALLQKELEAEEIAGKRAISAIQHPAFVCTCSHIGPTLTGLDLLCPIHGC